MSCRSSLISDWSCATSKLSVGGGVVVGDGGAVGEVMDDTVGWATSMILSVMSGSVSSDTPSLEEASTIRTWLGRHWRKSSRRRELSELGPAESSMSCCILRSN